MDAMRSLVPSPGAFMCFGPDDAVAYRDSARFVDAHSAGVDHGEHTLSAAFGFDRRNVVETPKRAYMRTSLYPDAEAVTVPYFRDHSVGDGFDKALLLFLHEGGVLFGLAGLERRPSDPPFDARDAERLEALAPFVISAARAQLSYDELSREASVLRALGKITGTLYAIDRDKKEVVWAANRERGVEWSADVAPIAGHIVDAAEQFLEAKKRGDALPTPPRLPEGTVVSVAKIEGDPVFGGARCAVLRVEPTEQKGASHMDSLSKREREIARLLVAGYSGVNVAAISGLSENTVRTYVRRLYGKLGVSNRADLVRKLMAPEPKSTMSGAGSVAPPPASSLAEGDDTLD